jgi:mono/diheme cytochrome c family protein
MKNKLVRIPLIAIPVFCVLVFLYMSYFNAAYDHPGKYVYKARCASCHGDNGEGTQSLVPPLAGADWAREHIDSIPCWLYIGMNVPIVVNGKPYEQTMYPISLTEVEMANLLNYMALEMVHVNKHYKADSLLVLMKKSGQTGLQ